MIFAKLDVCMVSHPKFIAAGPAAVGYWAAAIAYVREQELDGKLPDEAIGVMLCVGTAKGRKLAESLVKAGLFERTGDGYLICNYSSKNETKAQIEARRTATRERVQRFRCNGVTHSVTADTVTPSVTDPCNDSVPGSGSGSDLKIQRDPEIQDRGVRNPTDDGAFGMAISAWAEGISLETGVPCQPPIGGPLRQLVAASNAHRPVTADPVTWARETAQEYARAHRGRELSVFAFVRWLESGRPEQGSQVRVRPDLHPGKAPLTMKQIQEIQDRVAAEYQAEKAAKAAGGQR